MTKQTAGNNKLLKHVKAEWNKPTYAHVLAMVNEQGERAAIEYLVTTTWIPSIHAQERAALEVIAGIAPMVREPEYVYGMRNRPPMYATCPTGRVADKDADHPDYNFGTVTYPRRLTDEDLYRYEMCPVSTNAYDYPLGAKFDYFGDEAEIVGHQRMGRYKIFVADQIVDFVDKKDLAPITPPEPQPVKANVVELETAPQPHETVAITGVATAEPVAPPEPVTIGGTTGLYETITTGYLEGRGNYYQRLAKAGKITITTLDGMSITRARVVAGKVEVLERGGCWHVIGRNDTLIVAGV